MKVRQIIPTGQTEIIQEALNLLEFSLKILSEEDMSENIRHKLFDILQLRGMLNEDVIIEMSKDRFDNFASNYGVDFPEYIKPN